MQENEDYLRFVPSKVEGLPDVKEVVVRPDRMELLSSGKWVTFKFFDMVRWSNSSWLPRPWLSRFLFRVGKRSDWLPVADRDWFNPPAERYFEFYTNPPIKICMPVDELKEGYKETYFRRVQEIMAQGGFSTFDLG